MGFIGLGIFLSFKETHVVFNLTLCWYVFFCVCVLSSHTFFYFIYCPAWDNCLAMPEEAILPRVSFFACRACQVDAVISVII